MMTVYERAQDEIRRLEERLEELRIFVRMYEDISMNYGQLPKVMACRDSDVAEGDGPLAEPESEPEPEPEPETETERLAKLVLAKHSRMRVRELCERMVQLGYTAPGQKPHEVLRGRLLKSRAFCNEGGVFSLRSEA